MRIVVSSALAFLFALILCIYSRSVEQVTDSTEASDVMPYLYISVVGMDIRQYAETSFSS